LPLNLYFHREGTFQRYSANPEALQELLEFLFAECGTRNPAVSRDIIIAVGKKTGRRNMNQSNNQLPIAIIGGGPIGLAAAAHLVEKGEKFVGIKSYGRAPTFLILTGYEQARSVACALAGDWKGADATQLALPETGVCRTDLANSEEEDGEPSCACSEVDEAAERFVASCGAS
jgi:hypothetical protein